MKIALIQPPVEDFYYTPQRSYPLGLTYLAAAIQDMPVDVEIIDLISGHGRQTLPIPQNFDPIRAFIPYDRSPISAFHSYYHFGMPWNKIENLFNSIKFDLYAISSNFYTYSRDVIQTATIIKASNPDALILVGGQNVGPEHSLFTDCPVIDHCLQGEGDLAFHDFVEALFNKKDLSTIPGFYNPLTNTWNEPEQVCEFNTKPVADLLPCETYMIARKPSIMIATSRGCPMECRFCSVSRTFGKKLRLKPSHVVIEEIHHAYSRGIRAIDIEDDNFTFVRSHCTKLLTKIIREFNGKIELYAMNGLSAEHIDEEIVDLLYGAGMRLLNLSIATTSKEQLQAINRKTHIDKFQHISRLAASIGMKVMGHFIAGLPGQSSEDIMETMKVLSELPLVLGISPFYYIPGMNMDIPNPPKNCMDARLSRFWPADTMLDELDLITLFRLSRWINYLKNEMLKQKIKWIHFNDIQAIFKLDPYLSSLINERSILGCDSNNKFFSHQSSERILDSFFAIFKDSDVYCA